jgi:hypothetical protein
MLQPKAYLVLDSRSMERLKVFVKGILSIFVAGIAVAFAIAIVFVGAPLFSAILLVISIIAIIWLVAFLLFTQVFNEKDP